MKKLALVGFFLIVGVVGASWALSNLPYSRVVGIKGEMLEEDGKTIDRYTCSGGFIDDHGDIITARHCTPVGAVITIITDDGQEYLGTVYRRSKSHDLALIHIDRRGTPFYQLADEVNVGQPIAVLGSPLGLPKVFAIGVVAKIAGDDTLVDLSILPGNSGSPVFNQALEMVGVATAGYVVGFGVTHLNILQGLDAVYYFLANEEK